MDLAALYRQAVGLHQAGNLPAAEQLYRQILRADSGNAAALHMLGFLEAQRGRFADAVILLGQAVQAAPGDVNILSLHAHALMGAGRRDDALAAFGAVLACKPDAVDALYNRGVILSDRGEPQKALEDFTRALAMQPDAPGTLYNRGVALSDLGRHEEALANYERALQLQPNLALAAANRAHAALNLCDWPRMAEIAAQLKNLPVPPLTLLGYSDDKALQLERAVAAIRTEVPDMPEPLWRGERYNHDRIRLAYVSCDFNDHAVGAQIAPLIQAHDRTRFAVIGISTGGETESLTRERLKRGFDRFHHLAGEDSEAIARQMRDMEIDIAVDLGGHTKGARPRIFAHRPAPVQVEWLGYPGTTGAPFMDYLVGDAVVTPFADQPFFSEKLVQLPDSYFPTDPELRIGPKPGRAAAGLPETGFVFCCFNNGWKITQALFDAWMRLLKAVPGSVLWLRETPAQKNLVRAATEHGIDPARLVFAGFASTEDHLARQQLAGLFLDTAPYNAHATAAHALWAGLPVLTIKGHAFQARVGASLLQAIDLPELVTDNLKDYEAAALRLAQDAAALAEIRERLAKNRLAAPLFDLQRFRRNIEDAYTAMLNAR